MQSSTIQFPKKPLMFWLILAGLTFPLAAQKDLLKTAEIRIRDPFIYLNEETKTYYLYAQAANRKNSGYTGVETYTSKDLHHWTSPQRVLTIPDDKKAKMVWAPEVHAYKGAYYLFVTLTLEHLLSAKRPVNEDSWPAMHERGTYIYRAETPAGPFNPLKNSSHTPTDWMALDGTLFVDDGTPYMIFCHEWVQKIDGTMNLLELTSDLSNSVGSPTMLFKASDAPGAVTGATRGKVTDGCFLHRSTSGKLFMIWSTFIPGSGYCVLLTESETGHAEGPWIDQKVIYKNNGGHGMIFSTLEGQLLLALHQPNEKEKERLRLYEVTDTGTTLTIGDEFTSP